MFRVHLWALKYSLMALHWVNTRSLSLSLTWEPRCRACVTYVSVRKLTFTLCQCTEAHIDGFGGRGLVTVHRLICRFSIRSLKHTNTPAILPSITMAIHHIRTSTFSHLLFTGRSYCHIARGPLLGPLLQRLLIFSFPPWQDDVCCVLGWIVQLLDWAQWWESWCARTESHRGA